MMNSKSILKRVCTRAITATAALTILLATSCQKEADTTPANAVAPSNIKLNTSFKSENTLSTFLGKTITTASPISYFKKNNITISGLTISGGSLSCIQLVQCTNVRITHCKITNSTTYGIALGNCSNITIDSCLITNVAGGVFAVSCTGPIRVQYNQLQNMKGPFPKGSFIQFSNVTGTGNRIQYNVCENISGQSNPEDGISSYKSSGTASDPLLIYGNKIRGGGPSTTGSGITIGDMGGSYVTASNNIVVNSGYWGMQIAGGTYMTITGNTIYSAAFKWSHIGVGCGNYSGLPSNNLTISNNQVKWMCGDPTDLQYYKPVPTSMEKDGSYSILPTGWSTNIMGANISASVLPATLITYQ
jgi:parallel beta-helix repeat protein